MSGETDQGRGGKSRYVFAAWASPLLGMLVAAAFWLFSENYHGVRGVRSPAVLAFYLALIALSTAGTLAAIYSLLGIRSARKALAIVPGALLGVGINGFNVLWGMLAYLLEGKNIGG
jgi:hypothetical protein